MNVITKIANSNCMKNRVIKILVENKTVTVAGFENGIKKTQTVPVSNLKRLKVHLSAVFAAWFGILYNICIYKGNGVPKERKNTLVINNTITTFLGVVIGYGLDKMLDKPMEKWSAKLGKILDEVYKETPQMIKEDIEKMQDKKAVIAKGFKSMIPMLAFVFACRFVAPVIATPMADIVNKFLVKHKLIKNPEK